MGRSSWTPCPLRWVWQRQMLLASLCCSPLLLCCFVSGLPVPLRMAPSGPMEISARSLLQSNESSVVLSVTLASSSVVPSLQLLVTATWSDGSSETSAASALVSLSDVPASPGPAPTAFPVHSISATLDSPVDSVVHWQVLDASTCNSTGAGAIAAGPCTSAAVVWNVTTLPGDSKVINGTLLHQNFTAHNNASMNSSDPQGHAHLAGLYGILTLTDQAGTMSSTTNRELATDGIFQAEYFSHLAYTYSVNLPWSDFSPLAAVNLSTDVPATSAPPEPVSVSVSINPLCSSSAPQQVLVTGATNSPATVVSNAEAFYSGGMECSWLLSSVGGATLRYSFAVDMSRVGPGTRLRITDAAATSAAAGDDAGREYEGFSSAIDNSLLLEAREVRVTFEAAAGARAAPGPLVTVQALTPEDGMSAETVRRIIFAGTFTLIAVYIVSAIVAWKRYKVLDGRRQDNERVAARNAVRELAARRAREAIQAAQDRLRDASHALPEHLAPLIKIVNYGSHGKGPDGGTTGLGSTGLGGTGRSAVGATSPRPRAGRSGMLRQFSGLRSPTAADAAPESPEGPLSAVLGDEPCAICLGDYEEEEEAAILPCGHMFHAPCVQEWFKRSRECPMCKADVAEALQEQLDGGRAG